MSGKWMEIVCHPREEVTHEEFIATHEPFSIGIDGYCKGPTFFDPRGPWLNINHHNCDDDEAEICGVVRKDEPPREALRSSCKQAFNFVRTGLFESFRRCGHPHGIAHINDIDDDVTFTTYVLRHSKHVEQRPRLKQMVDLVDLLDTVNGFFPVKKRWHLLKMIIWIMEPYNEARMDGSLYQMDADAMHAMLERMHERIRKTMYGKGHETEPDMRYEVIEEHGSFVVVREIGRYARYKLAQKGYKSFLTVTELESGRLQCTIGRQSQFISDLPLDVAYKRLNAREPLLPSGKRAKHWGGSDIGGGSPRSRDPKETGTGQSLGDIVGEILEIKKEFAGRACAVNHH